MCNSCYAKISPKDETWWEDMDRDADAYYESIDEEEEEE